LPVKALYPTKVVHNDLFTEEDVRSIDLGSRLTVTILRFYEDPEWPDVGARRGIADKVGTLDLQLKQTFNGRAHTRLRFYRS